MKKYLAAFFLYLFSILLCACAKSDNSSPSACESFTVISRGKYSALGAGERVITGHEEWLAVSHQIGLSPESIPNIDFRKDSVIVVGMGDRPTGGYAVDVAGIKCEPDKTVIYIKQSQPHGGGVVTLESSQPYVAVRIVKPKNKVVFLKGDINN